ncbi:unnamed protein product [Linum trigynum]|uniref:Uncharacterized protein n=1 Tax=Linum trigynum TaxID=586398 RepID=A0AAV2FLB9_9ROSI
MEIGERRGSTAYVNRLGLCLIHATDRETVIRTDDSFGWSKYGVELPEAAGVQGSVGFDAVEANNEELRRSLEEKTVELAACKKELEEKSMELTVCMKELEWSKKMEKLMNQLVEEKEKVNEMMKIQLHH